jgi:asparagine synthetase B (glutamine-hydrolysing)
MENLTPWKSAILLPVISRKTNNWNLVELEQILKLTIGACIYYCQQNNNNKICTTLSGGLDSSLCLAIIRSLIEPKVEIHTFTTGGGIEHPDIQAARLVSKLFGTIHHELIPTQQEIEEAAQKVFSTWQDEPNRLANVGVFLTYRHIAANNFQTVLAHDGIDELLGGYWEHRQPLDENEKRKAFELFWGKLKKDHLLLLTRKARYFGIEVIFPYLQQKVIEYISAIPVEARTTRQASKIPLRIIAESYLPQEIIERKKVGFCSVLDMY